jgi:DNA sulfur modification protein DndB
MSVIVPAIKASMGSRDYFITKMRAAELTGQVAVASELQDWKQLTLEELYQRAVDERRVKQDIAPYLVSTNGRFFGSIIVWILSPEAVVFESVTGFASIRAAYRNAAESLGFLTVDGHVGGKGGLVALDGQHRLSAFREVVQGKVDGKYRSDVGDDEVAVVLVQDKDIKTARDLFTVLNRSARRVSKNDVLIMSEVDGAAIVARRITSSDLLAPRGLTDKPLVKWISNTISRNDLELTTLNAIYEIVKLVAGASGVDVSAGEEAGNPPPEEILQAIQKETFLWLTQLFSCSAEFSSFRDDPLRIPSARGSDRQYSLMLKPIGFQAFFGAVRTALSTQSGGLEDLKEVVTRLLQLDWSLESSFWQGILVTPRGTVTNKQADLSLGSDLAAWMVTGNNCTPSFQQSLTERYRRQLNRGDVALPTPRWGAK